MLDCRTTVLELQDIFGALYLAVYFLGCMNAMSVQSVVFIQRSVCCKVHQPRALFNLRLIASKYIG